MDTTGYKEYTSDNDPQLCNKCGHNSWREGSDGDLFCVPCMYGMPISNDKATEIATLLNRRLTNG